MSIKFNAGMQDTKEGQLSAFQRTSWLFPRPVDANYTTLPFFPHFLFCSLNVTEKKKQPPQSLGASLSTGGLVSQIFLRTYLFLPLQGDSSGVRFPLR